jgi:hypothetical protein
MSQDPGDIARITLHAVEHHQMRVARDHVRQALEDHTPNVCEELVKLFTVEAARAADGGESRHGWRLYIGLRYVTRGYVTNEQIREAFGHEGADPCLFQVRGRTATKPFTMLEAVRG